MLTYKQWLLENNKTENNITSVILNMIKKYGKSPYDINNGSCEDFAIDVVEEMGGENDELYIFDLHNFSGTDEDPSSDEFSIEWLNKHGYELPKGVTVDDLNKKYWAHIFIKYKDKYYDAEATYGVNSPFKLPIIYNNLGLNN